MGCAVEPGWGPFTGSVVFTCGDAITPCDFCPTHSIIDRGVVNSPVAGEAPS